MAKIRYIRGQNSSQSDEYFDRVYIERASGKENEYPERERLIDYLRSGDVVYFDSFSAISNNITDLLYVLNILEDKGVYFVSEKDQISTNGESGRIVAAVLAAISNFEREINLEASASGFRRNNKPSRPATEIFTDLRKSIGEMKRGEISAAEPDNHKKNSLYGLFHLYDEEERPPEDMDG